MVVLGGVAVSYERGTPVQLSDLKDRAFAGAIFPRDEVHPDVV